MFARRHSNRLSSTLEQRLRISSALMLHFSIRRVDHDKNGWERRRPLSSRSRFSQSAKPYMSDHFDKLAFPLNKKFTDVVIFSHADTLTGCPANNIIKFRAYRRLICCYPPRMSRETWVGMSMAFSSSMKIFLLYVPDMHVIVFTRSYSVARALWRPHSSAVANCNTRKGPSQAPTREP